MRSHEGKLRPALGETGSLCGWAEKGGVTSGGLLRTGPVSSAVSGQQVSCAELHNVCRGARALESSSSVVLEVGQDSGSRMGWTRRWRDHSLWVFVGPPPARAKYTSGAAFRPCRTGCGHLAQAPAMLLGEA